jgi:hypothetical protein
MLGQFNEILGAPHALGYYSFVVNYVYDKKCKCPGYG